MTVRRGWQWDPVVKRIGIPGGVFKPAIRLLSQRRGQIVAELEAARRQLAAHSDDNSERRRNSTRWAG